jgi:hypothetical protein
MMMPRTEYSNTKTKDNWNYLRMLQRFDLFERLAIAARLVRHGAIELELFWLGDKVFIDSVSLRFGEGRLERFKEGPE